MKIFLFSNIFTTSIVGDEKVVVASFFSHHLCVFDMEKKDHVQTLENDNSLLHLYVAALTYDGSFLVHTNYDEDDKVSRLLDIMHGMISYYVISRGLQWFKIAINV